MAAQPARRHGYCLALFAASGGWAVPASDRADVRWNAHFVVDTDYVVRLAQSESRKFCVYSSISSRTTQARTIFAYVTLSILAAPGAAQSPRRSDPAGSLAARLCMATALWAAMSAGPQFPRAGPIATHPRPPRLHYTAYQESRGRRAIQ